MKKTFIYIMALNLFLVIFLHGFICCSDSAKNKFVQVDRFPFYIYHSFGERDKFHYFASGRMGDVYS